MKNTATDLLLVAIPKHGVNVPPLALAYLQGLCLEFNIDVEVRDLNIELWEDTIQTEWYEIWLESNETLYRGENFYKFYDEFYSDYIEKWSTELANHPAKFIGISCFSYRSFPTLKYLVPKIKEKNPAKLIIVGGSPVQTHKDWILENNLADYAVANEGENALLDIILNGCNKGYINKPQIEDLDKLPQPDYTGLDFNRYVPGDPGGLKVRHPNYKREKYEAGIMASRGCVRACSFCDVDSFYPKFKWRSAENIYDEMLELFYNGIKDIYFFDSLINGNQKELEKLCDLIIADGSQFDSIKGLGIIKNQPERLYKKLSDANFKQMTIGIESFSPKLRADMNKGFTDELLKQNLDMYNKYNIDVALLLIVGFPSQTEEDHLEEYRWMRDNSHYANAPVRRVEIGGTMLILPGAPVFKNREYELFTDKNGDWVSFPNGETNNMAVRIRRREQIEQWAAEFGFRVGSTYGEGGQMIGDPEKNQILDYKRPQDNLISLYDATHEIGWESDPTRPTHQQ